MDKILNKYFLDLNDFIGSVKVTSIKVLIAYEDELMSKPMLREKVFTFSKKKEKAEKQLSVSFNLMK
jgi:hypothetical protein